MSLSSEVFIIEGLFKFLATAIMQSVNPLGGSHWRGEFSKGEHLCNMMYKLTWGWKSKWTWDLAKYINKVSIWNSYRKEANDSTV